MLATHRLLQGARGAPDGVAGGIGDIAFRHRALIDEVVQVPESEIADAIVALLAEDQVVAEGAGALAAAALRCGLLRDDSPTALVISGGNIDARHLAGLLAARPS
jgi:threonine dehydratase